VYPATYSVVAAKSGYTSQTLTGKAVSSNQTTTANFTLTAQSSSISETFDSMPSWTSSWNATWGSAATWTITSGGASGNCLQAARSSEGSSAKVKVYDVSPNTTYTVSVYMKCPSYGATYWMETACKLGSYSAQDFDDNGTSWTLIKKFNTSNNGNNNTWTPYSVSINTGSNTQISIGYKLGSSGGAGPTVAWDTLLIQ
jgi:hypothetical protein